MIRVVHREKHIVKHSFLAKGNKKLSKAAWVLQKEMEKIIKDTGM